VFLTAEWRYLAILNFEIDAGLMAARVPAGTELDLFEGRAFVSLVGFRFLDTRLLGFRVPFHHDFDEVNLRFYVRRREAGAVKRGVVFIQEIVPRRSVAQVARWVYRENYRALPMSHAIADENAALRVEYSWRFRQRWNRIAATTAGYPRETADGSLAQFITEHYWGYNSLPGGGTVEYHVTHPSWRVWDAAAAEFSGDAASLYGREFAAILNRTPDSAFVAEGSPVTVYRKKEIAALMDL
jgi:uncharacterized protein YqjF (DUF2071 family)